MQSSNHKQNPTMNNMSMKMKKAHYQTSICISNNKLLELIQIEHIFSIPKDITSKIMEISNWLKSFVYKEKSYYNIQINDFAKSIDVW